MVMGQQVLSQSNLQLVVERLGLAKAQERLGRDRRHPRQHFGEPGSDAGPAQAGTPL